MQPNTAHTKLNAPVPSRDLVIGELAKGRVHYLALTGLGEFPTGNPMTIPAIVVKGAEEGAVLGVVSTIHGNELNGIRVIHRLVRAIDPHVLRGTVIAIPIVNLPGFQSNQRGFCDGYDLNRLMPGKADGFAAQAFAYQFFEMIVKKLDVLIDLHTASFGRANSLYVRADMRAPETAALARMLNPQIIVHKAGEKQTLRRAAQGLGIPTITVEVGDPQRFQHGLIRSSRLGIQDVMEHLDMLPKSNTNQPDEPPIECNRSFWLYTDAGGLLEVLPAITDRVEAGESVAQLTTLYGEVKRVYRAPEAGIVVGKSTNPVAHTGSRILHLGIIRTDQTDWGED